MTNKEKCIITVFCLILLVLAGCILMRYYHRVNEITALEKEQSVDRQRNLVGYHYTTTAAQLTKSDDSDETTSKRTFSHKVYTQNEQDLPTVTVTVSANISDDGSFISHISTSLADEQMDGLTISEHLNEETATVVLYVNQISICHFQYRVSPDGSIDLL